MSKSALRTAIYISFFLSLSPFFQSMKIGQNSNAFNNIQNKKIRTKNL